MSNASRWAQVKAVFQEALERDETARGAYLEAACAGDAPLRAEVESLLAAHLAAGRFAEGSPLEALPPSAVDALGLNTELAPGSKLGSYEIAALLGSGGMGQVYRARDTTLNRDVAVKVLPDLFALDRDRLARFTREAQMLAALNHPSIVTVHSVEEDRGVHFITMELVKGQTLAALLPREGFALDRFFDIALPLAEAVAAAHAQEIVHRDLKPANVMVTADGRVKVLDFGLARPTTGAAGPGDITAITEAGMVVGTYGYLSPEQARGQTVDLRTDIFALGIIFYEMLTGRRPFAGATLADVLSSVMKDVPPLVSSLRPGVPRELSRLVRLCLSKDPSRRMQSALDIRNELDQLKREMDSGELFAEARPAPVRAWGTSRAWWTAGAVIILLLGGAASWMLSEPRPAPGVRLSNPRQLTFTTGVESFPSWSPDRGRIAYVSDQSGNNDIWVVPAAGGAARNFTDHPGNDTEPAWSPDGNQIAFISYRDPDRGGIYVMPALGGRPERISPRGSAESVFSPQWSADGTELAHMRREPEGNVIEIVSLATRQTRRIAVPGEQGNRFDLSWSRDGRYFAYVRAGSRDGEVNRLWVLRAADGEAFAVTDGTTGDWSPMWSADGHTLFFLSNRGGSVDLWQQRITAQGTPAGEASPLTVGIGMQAAALSADGRTLAYARGRRVANVWRVPILDDREAGWEDADQLTFDEAAVVELDLHPDGQLIMSSDRGGSRDLWLVAMDGTEMRQLTASRGSDNAPRFSPDGSRIAFHSIRQGYPDIWVLPTDGGPAVKLTTNPMSDMYPSWSPDGRMIGYYGLVGGGWNLLVVPASGGEPHQVTTGDVSKYYPQWSPDANWIFFSSGSERQIFRMPAAGGAPEQVTKALVSYFRWSPDGTRLYFPGNERGSNNLWELTVANGRERRLTRFPPDIGELGPYALAASKTHLYFTLRKDVGDIWVMDVSADDER